ncbi:ester cyclase [Undibacterium sp.]|uniref:ester cyclase n=1 Tax=Undibacterium sp. TaxID=1914977 RepID=UPI002B650884|nr:ester cyclase [Undibacterium sp.]HTD04847.1 ester cyclase [Undibacterium sp.]
MINFVSGDSAKAVVRRSIDELLNSGKFDSFDDIFSEDFVDHTPQPGNAAGRTATRNWYLDLRAAFPDLYVEMHWQVALGDVVTSFSTFQGTHLGAFLDAEATGKKVRFDSVDVMRVHGGKIKEHWGAANLFSLAKQLELDISAKRKRKARELKARNKLIHEIVGG